MKKQFTVIGLGRFGTAVTKGLAELGNEVIAVDIDEKNINNLESQITHGLIGDSTDQSILLAAGVKEVDVVIIGVTDFKTSVMTALQCKELGAKKVIAKARDQVHEKVLIKIGVDKAIIPERDTGYKIAHNLVYGDALDVIRLNSDYEIVEIMPPEKWLDSSLAKLDIRKRYGITILGINRDSEFIVNPSPDSIMKQGDTILVLGKVDDIARLNG